MNDQNSLSLFSVLVLVTLDAAGRAALLSAGLVADLVKAALFAAIVLMLGLLYLVWGASPRPLRTGGGRIAGSETAGNRAASAA